MKLKNLMYSGLILAVLTLFGCGGGGGSDAPSGTTKISGVASVAPINGGTVEVFKIVNGAKVTPAIASGKTDANGSYSLSWQSYNGPVLVEVSGGNYTDPATGTTSSLAAPLRAVVPNASGTVSAAVTPFTELAVQLTGANLTTAAIIKANEDVAIMFNIVDDNIVDNDFSDNIIKNQPLAPTANALTAATPAQRSYTLALAAFSQIVKDQSGTVAGTITSLKGNSATAAATLQNAAATFFTTANSNNTTGVIVKKLRTTGTLPADRTIRGIGATINLPSGVSVKSDNNGLLAGYLQTSGSATASSIISGNLNGSDLKIIFADIDGIAVGEFAMLYCDVASTAPVPLGIFTIPSVKITDVVSGNTVELSVSITIQ